MTTPASRPKLLPDSNSVFNLAELNLLLTRRPYLVLLVLAVACLPGEPTITIDFVLPTETPLPIAINTTTTPSIVVTVDGEELPTADYRLESLDGAVVSVTTDGTGLIGLVRDTTIIRVVFEDASGEVSDTFRVVGVASRVGVTSPTDTLVKPGETVELTAEAFDGNDDGIAVTSFEWWSSDESVVTVDGVGTVTAMGPGEADVSAMIDGVSDSANLVMRIVVSSVDFITLPLTLPALKSTTPLTVFALDGDGDAFSPPLENTVFDWWSFDSTIAAVDSNGILTAHGNGTTFVVAELGGEIDSLLVTVDQIAFAVLVNPDNVRLARTDTTRFTVKVFDSNSQEILNPSVTWTSSNDLVASVSGGLVTALTLGAATITAEVDSVRDTAALDVLEPQSLVITPSTNAIDAWLDTTRLVATVRDGSNTVIYPVTIAWMTDDPTIATVENDGSDGLVTGRGNGTATVTATAPLNVTNTATISVNQLQVSRVVVSPLGLDLSTIGGPDLLSATAQDEAGNAIRGIATWRSLNPYSATIDSFSGMVTAHASGQVTMAADIAGVTGYGLVTVAAPDAAPVRNWVQDLALGDEVRSIWGLSPNMVWAANPSRGIYWFDGVDWFLQHDEVGCCHSFWGSSEADVWAAATAPSRLLHWDGMTWTTVVTFADDGIGQLWGSAPNDAWVTVSSGRLYHYDEVAWTLADSLGNAFKSGIWGSAANNIWTAGIRVDDTILGGTQPAGPVQLFRFRGSGWRRVRDFEFSVRGQRLWGTASQDVWMLSKTPFAGTAVIRLQGNGWSRVGSFAETPGLGPSVWGTSANEMYAALGFGKDQGPAYRFNDGAWESISLPSGFSAFGVGGTSKGPVWIVGKHVDGGLLRGVRQ